MQPHIRAFVDRAATFAPCPDCGGTRLSDGARSSKIAGISIADACAMQVSDLAEWSAGSTVRRWRRSWRLSARPSIPSYRSAWRPVVGPSVGDSVGWRGATHEDGAPPRLRSHRRHVRFRRAHDRDCIPTISANERTAAAVARQGQHRARGRTRAGDAIAIAGSPRRPRPGRRAAREARSSSRAARLDCGPRARSPANHLERPRGAQAVGPRAPAAQPSPSGGATTTTCVRRRRCPAGRARGRRPVSRAPDTRSSMVRSPRRAPAVVSIDQGAIRGSRRSNPATYTGLLDPIRKAFAKANGVKAVPLQRQLGRCLSPTCKGAGVISYTEPGFMDTVATPCEDLRG